jgi:Protein of unknown function (DUF3253)
MATIRDSILLLLASRLEDGSICPSEVARFMAAGEGGTARRWRDKMPEVHAAVDELLHDGLIKISWKGKALDARAGAYRIRRSRRELIQTNSRGN